MKQKDPMRHPRTMTHHDPHPGLQAEFEQVLLAESSKAFFTPSPVLKALDDMLIKTKRIAAFLGIARPSVTAMLAGKRPTPAKYHDKLLILLRDAVRLGRQACRDAESGKTTFKGKPFTEEVIQFMRSRIDTAETVLRQHENSQ